ncbi:hypothetical protein B0H17DRAFT_1186981 [Mycena rosella]|uniref:Uncharacterized protein n=1 Tax=Mycena rosella TaxID=1033263 RepID=A0AAD7FZ75_MYCRO|nr:hypothetical protein B0H17DRAFT_1186981 [Mycena rosella]
MAFSFLTSGFFNVQNPNSLPTRTPPATPALPSRSLPPPLEISGTTSFQPTSFNDLNSMNFPPLPRDPHPFSSTPARYVPKAFIYNTPVNPVSFGAVHDPGYTSLSTLTASYHLPLSPATPSIPQFPTKPTPCDTYLEHYQAGHIVTRKSVGNCWEIQCNICDKWILTSVPCRRPLAIPNHFANLESHCQSLNKCKPRTTRAAPAPPEFSPCKRPAASSSAKPAAESDEDEEDDEFQFQHGRSSSMPPEVPSRTEPSPSPMVVVQMCPGNPLDWPVDVGPFMETFPFHRIGVHQEEVRKWRLKRFMDAVAEMNVSRLQQLVSVGLRRGSSPTVIVRMMQSALEGVYRPRPVLDSRTLDIALMVYRLGGRKLLYAVNHGLGLPSLRTLRNHMSFTKIMPTVGTISIEDIIHNIREVVLKPRDAAFVHQPLRGVSLLIDEVALEERTCHFRHNNSVGGLCWRHSPKLYGDSQLMIKNAFFCLAKQQKLDPTQRFLFQIGDDPLERLFGKLRMLGGHNSAMSYAQAIERLGHACDLQSVYLRQPDLDQGQRRISMKRSEAWDDGSKIAQQIFAKLHFPPDSYNYPVPASAESTPSTLSTDTISSTPSGVTTYPPSTTATPTLPSMAPSVTSTPPVAMTTAPDDDDDIENQGDGISFEDSLNEIPELALPTGRGVDPNDYLNVEGKWVHKQRICRVVINADFEPKSTERLKRVRGHTKVNAKKRDDVNPEAILGANTFIVGDPFFTLLRTEQTLSLAIVHSTAIHEDGISHGSILAPTIRNPNAKVKLSGQVLNMTLIPTLDDNLPESEALLVEHGLNPMKKCALPTIAGTTQTTKKAVIVSVPGVLAGLVNYRPVDAVPRLGEHVYEINSEGRSWELDGDPMGAVCELLWDAVVEQNITLTSLASVKKSEASLTHSTTVWIPKYIRNPALVCQQGTQLLIQQNDDKVQRVCHLCGDRPGNWRAHISTHILHFIRGVNEALRLPECEVHLSKKGKVTHVATNCPMVSTFHYKPAEQGSKTTPCRNVPVVCGLCFPDPLDLARPGGTRLPHEVWESMKLDPTEETALGIPTASIPRVFEDVAGPDEGVDRADVVGKKRAAKKSAPGTSQRKRTGA